MSRSAAGGMFRLGAGQLARPLWHYAVLTFMPPPDRQWSVVIYLQPAAVGSHSTGHAKSSPGQDPLLLLTFLVFLALLDDQHCKFSMCCAPFDIHLGHQFFPFFVLELFCMKYCKCWASPHASGPQILPLLLPET